MNRRGFLKALACAVVTPVVLSTADILIPAGPIDKTVYRAIGHGKGGITNEQLHELIQTTLENLPKGLWNDLWDEAATFNRS